VDAATLLATKRLRETTLHVDVEGGSVGLVLRALPRSQYRELLEAHPPVKDGEDWNADTFCPALIAASSVDPELSLEQATDIWEGWETEEASRLFLASYYLNEDHKRLGFILRGSATTGGSAQNSTTASPKESPTPTS
jgi:hypothetical protein